MSDIINNILKYPDHWLNNILPEIFVVLVWGFLSGLLSIVLYKLISNQKQIKELKTNLSVLRKEMLNYDLDANEYKTIIKKNLSLSLQLLYKVFIPSVISGLPVIFIALYVDYQYSYRLDDVEKSQVQVTFEPASAKLKFNNGVEKNDDGQHLYNLKTQGEVLVIEHNDNVVYRGIPDLRHFPILHKKHWWNLIQPNSSGYIEKNSIIDAIYFHIESRKLIQGVPYWASSWHLVFFVSIILSALYFKFRFRIS